MPVKINFALNHITTPRLDSRAFLNLAAGLGCGGVELRNDLADKGLSSAAFLDGEAPGVIGDYARSKGLRLFGLSEAYVFNSWSDPMRAKIQLLIDQAKEAGAESISLIPRNDEPRYAEGERDAELRRSLDEILAMLDKSGMVALIEPLGFVTSSLRRKADAVAAIEAVGGKAHLKLVHDTFHHYLAGESDYFPEYTGIVHFSGVIDPSLMPEDMQDVHRIIVDDRDRLENVGQIGALLGLGYTGAFSFELFSPDVHALSDHEGVLRKSMDFVRSRIIQKAA